MSRGLPRLYYCVAAGYTPNETMILHGSNCFSPFFLSQFLLDDKIGDGNFKKLTRLQLIVA